MRFGMLYELQLPKPWDTHSEQRLVDNAIEQCVLGDKLGIDYAWSVEHHFLEEYSHCSASDVFLAAIAAKTERIKIGFGIRQVISNYNHPDIGIIIWDKVLKIGVASFVLKLILCFVGKQASF